MAAIEARSGMRALKKSSRERPRRVSDDVRLCAKRPGATKPPQTPLWRALWNSTDCRNCSRNAPFVPRHRALEHRHLQDLLVGETGFEPATARPPAGAIQLLGSDSVA